MFPPPTRSSGDRDIFLPPLMIYKSSQLMRCSGASALHYHLNVKQKWAVKAAHMSKRMLLLFEDHLSVFQVRGYQAMAQRGKGGAKWRKWDTKQSLKKLIELIDWLDWFDWAQECFCHWDRQNMQFSRNHGGSLIDISDGADEDISYL